jgi:hypothetical protein
MGLAPIQVPELRVPQPEDPLQNYARIMQLRSAMQSMQYQQQMQPLELESQRLQVQQQQRSAQSQQALLRALTENPGADPDQLAQTAMKYNAYPGDILPAINNLKESAIKTQQLRGQTLDNVTKINNVYGAQAQMLLGIQDPAQRQQTYQQVSVPALRQVGMDPSQIRQAVPDQATLEAHRAMAMTTDQQLDQARKTQEYEQTHGIIDPSRLGQINQMFAARWQALHGTQAVPQTFQLGQQATYDDFNRTDKLMEQTEKAEATQAQWATVNAMRNQTYTLAAQGRDEQDYQRNLAELDRTFKPVTDTLPRLARLQATLAQNSPQADALVAPELLTVMAGGPGSGLRMNEAEISRIIGGRSKWQDLQAAAQKWSLDPTQASSITPEQRIQIHNLVNAVTDKMQQQQQAYSYARQQLLGTADPTARRQVVTNAAQRSMQINTLTAGGGAGHVIQIGSKFYQYNGSGDTANLTNYTEVTGAQR